MYVDHIFLKKQDWQITYLKLKKCSFQWSEHLLRLIQDLAMKGVLITHLLFHFFWLYQMYQYAANMVKVFDFA